MIYDIDKGVILFRVISWTVSVRLTLQFPGYSLKIFMSGSHSIDSHLIGLGYRFHIRVLKISYLILI